tara:strand:- start:8464 stop:8757 length:294 start_codon:yes stop_codon:yes gene_type:complete
MHKIPKIIGSNGDFCQVMKVIVQETADQRLFYTEEGQMIGMVTQDRSSSLAFGREPTICKHGNDPGGCGFCLNHSPRDHWPSDAEADLEFDAHREKS